MTLSCDYTLLGYNWYRFSGGDIKFESISIECMPNKMIKLYFIELLIILKYIHVNTYFWKIVIYTKLLLILGSAGW